jgi:rhodanese-related sulfurtransferase
MTRTNWQRDTGRALLIVLFWCLVAAAFNTVSPHRIAWVGPWPSTYGADTASVPPSYEDDDPPVLRLDAAIAMFQAEDIVFIDARDPEDYVLGHIPGALSLPFDYYDDYAEDILAQVDRDREVVTYCGGADCELSLYLARQLRIEGYTRVYIFFGGSEAWEQAGLPLAKEGT